MGGLEGSVGLASPVFACPVRISDGSVYGILLRSPCMAASEVRVTDWVFALSFAACLMPSVCMIMAVFHTFPFVERCL